MCSSDLFPSHDMEVTDLFDVYLIGEDNHVKNTLEGIYFDQLVEVIDDHVELVQNYNERVNQEYNIDTL